MRDLWFQMICLINLVIFVSPGTIVTARKFDRERQREYAVTVTATDQAADPLIGICQLTIHILDQNDNNPKFENIRYECKKSPCTHTHTHLLLLSHQLQCLTQYRVIFTSTHQPMCLWRRHSSTVGVDDVYTLYNKQLQEKPTDANTCPLAYTIKVDGSDLSTRFCFLSGLP